MSPTLTTRNPPRTLFVVVSEIAGPHNTASGHHPEHSVSVFEIAGHPQQKKKQQKQLCFCFNVQSIYFFFKKNQNGTVSQVRAKWEEKTRGMHV
jgi:hypothetical protein